MLSLESSRKSIGPAPSTPPCPLTPLTDRARHSMPEHPPKLRSPTTSSPTPEILFEGQLRVCFVSILLAKSRSPWLNLN